MSRYPLVFCLLCLCLPAEEKRVVTHIEEKDLPPAVRQAAKQDVPAGAPITGYEKITEAGQHLFEVKIEVAGKDQELLYRADGKLAMREEETTIDQIPAPARAAIQKAARLGTIRKVDRIQTGRRVLYEGELLIEGQKSKVIFDRHGKPQKP